MYLSEPSVKLTVFALTWLLTSTVVAGSSSRVPPVGADVHVSHTESPEPCALLRALASVTVVPLIALIVLVSAVLPVPTVTRSPTDRFEAFATVIVVDPAAAAADRDVVRATSLSASLGGRHCASSAATRDSCSMSDTPPLALLTLALVASMTGSPL